MPCRIPIVAAPGAEVPRTCFVIPLNERRSLHPRRVEAPPETPRGGRRLARHDPPAPRLRTGLAEVRSCEGIPRMKADKTTARYTSRP